MRPPTASTDKDGSEGLLRRYVEESDSAVVIVTGMSGAGKSTAADVLEDGGWHVVDNFPPQLLGDLRRLREEAKARGQEVPKRLALVIDARTRWLTEQSSTFVETVRAMPARPVLVFLDATDESLVRRFESVRRPHPLQGSGRLLDAIQNERAVMADLRSVADVIVDTSGLNVHQLTQKVSSLVGASTGRLVRVAVMSFGFKYGIPLDADFVADMRFLPNPFWVPELRPLSGQDRDVADYVMAQPGASEFIERFVTMLDPVLRGYQDEGRRYATIALGCTGGKHRSVAMAEAIAARLDPERVVSFVVHRDLGHE